MKKLLTALLITLPSISLVYAQETNLYWGDTHLHTSNSMDAYFFSNGDGTPEAAYRWAKGLPVINTATRALVQIETPLDFLVVSDHAEYMAIPKKLFTIKDESLRETEFGQTLVKLWEAGNVRESAATLIGTVNDLKPYAPFVTDEIRRSGWDEVIKAADDANEAGKFTAFIGWEWTSFPEGSNLHRVIFTPQGGNMASKYLPFSALDSSDPEKLWNWLEKTTNEKGAELIAIPHNGNVSNGLMFSQEDYNGKPIDLSYAKLRARWEPIYEVTQIKGDSETHSSQSPDDEFADYETYAHLIDVAAITAGEKMREVVAEGDYARRALRTGLMFEQTLGVNPFKFGLIGSTDSHTTYSSAEENNFQGKFSSDATPEARRDLKTLPGTENMWAVSAAGLAGVWAKENTRESLYAAFKRKEVYATTGPRIAVRFFGGFDFVKEDAESKDIAGVGYTRGVPMGGDLTKAPKNKPPSFLVQAVKDPVEANLDRIQIVKGWLTADGTTEEKVFNVAVSDGRTIKNNKVTVVGNTVDLETGAYTNTIGTAQLAVVWEDPEFDPNQRAFYYARVIQIPTPRYSLFDAIALQMDYTKTGHPATIQERAYSSPIWYTP